ncbi:Alcohol dehydrogenase superfamily, zinc-type [Penicillium expansum]|uniref:Alcohol dehydrogenase superfamily, zinc-type n=1 Tax=Penicillium expansum TaxID=27334 RepID=A0A0A2JDI6_PENEN|nr:Alcohol dehydrogenase superfamily, zinc-type [Penicillium expansum]KGO43667.1 Alcohol dehydrogenase superfamily, zinc-type [Penicillium expansum]KGO52693.1 Alcohol dehydrogenase superfamily, zinc-type [Penicillium expansum]KGO57840.1 Alcohol dehydrogenase superfamily, zinc-type [Penicillium expansum]
MITSTSPYIHSQLAQGLAPAISSISSTAKEDSLPRSQIALVLQGLRQPYTITPAHPVPLLSYPDELMIKIQAIGLNPIDWKSVDYGFGIPSLPYIAGRDFAGVIIKAPRASSYIEGDVVLCASTDYRDQRKAAYQEYAIAQEHTVCKLPSHVPVTHGAALGVAYVAATLALGVCLGLRFPALTGNDLCDVLQSLPPDSFSADVRSECQESIDEHERPCTGDWVAIWGGSSTSALFLSQIASLAGLKVILVVDVARHGARLANSGCLLVDCHDPARAVVTIRGITQGSLRFGIDTVGKETATQLTQCLEAGPEKRAHLVALAALPKKEVPGIVYHSVPMKIFHEVPEIGKCLMLWLGIALEKSLLSLPTISTVPGGLSGINTALDQMRQGQVSGRRLVVPI